MISFPIVAFLPLLLVSMLSGLGWLGRYRYVNSRCHDECEQKQNTSQINHALGFVLSVRLSTKPALLLSLRT